MASANEQQAISLAMDFTSEYDLVADKAKMEMTMNMGSGLLGGMEFVTKTYTTDNASYMGTSDLSGGFTWTKYPVNESQGVKKSVESMLAVIDSLEGTVIGTETINGKQTDKIKVDADVEKVVRTLISSQAESLGNIDEAQINEAVGTIKDAITKLDLTLWVAKDTSLPVKLKADADLAIDLGAMYGSTGSEQMLEMSMALTANFDFESAVSIVVPPEALEAVDYGTALNDLEYESVCGDGWCDWNENSTSCPADCYCGDGLCLGEENETNCAEDCAQAIQ
jgi:hypothetical protein